MYLHCPECRLTVYRPVAQSANSRCPRCGREAVWSSPPFARAGELHRVAERRARGKHPVAAPR